MLEEMKAVGYFCPGANRPSQGWTGNKIQPWQFLSGLPPFFPEHKRRNIRLFRTNRLSNTLAAVGVVLEPWTMSCVLIWMVFKEQIKLV